MTIDQKACRALVGLCGSKITKAIRDHDGKDALELIKEIEKQLAFMELVVKAQTKVSKKRQSRKSKKSTPAAVAPLVAVAGAST